jgi:acyl CoA:acetate/3-ketoacid CoA transferase alpha subunit
MQVELNPHTFAERIRGEFDGPPVRPRIERGLRGNFAFVKAWKGDSLGQSHLSQDRPQLQSHDDHRRETLR